MEGDNGKYESGLAIWQQPNIPSSQLFPKYAALEKITDKTARQEAIEKMRNAGEMTTTRLFIGKNRDDDASVLRMSDIKGRTRIEMSVEANGNPKLNFLDETGKVIYSLPENAASKK